MDAHTLVGATSGVSSDEELEMHIKNLHVPDAVKQLLEILIANMGDELKVTATHPQLGLQARLSGKGLSHVVKTIAKFIPGGNEA